MDFLKQTKIGTRLGVGFGAVILVLLLLVAGASVGLRKVDAVIEDIVHVRYPQIRVVAELTDDLNVVLMSVRNIAMLEDPAKLANEFVTVKDTREAIADDFERLAALVTTETGKRQLANVQAARADFVKTLDEFLARASSGNRAQAQELVMGEMDERQLAYLRALSVLTHSLEKGMEESGTEVMASADWLMLALWIAAAVAALGGVAIAVAATRSVTRPLGQAVDALREVEAGNLAVEIRNDRGDELGQMLGALANTVASLRGVVLRVHQGVESVTTASSEIAAGNQDLSSRTEQQASSLQETAASMEQFSGTIRQSADNARQANQLASAASEAAARGGEVVGHMVTTMNEISDSSRKIADIIGVIDGIAFQTNILALNAAVEAARAGEQGRGFAVVASEVRSLAKRSGDAAREIKTLIGSSVDRVEAGVRQAGEAGAAIETIVTQARKVTDLIAEISSAAVEQSSGIGQVSQAVSQMDQVTQQNAALVEEAAAAAQSLNQQARQLAEAVSVFRMQPA